MSQQFAPTSIWASILSARRYVLALYCGLTLLMTFPLLLSWRSTLPAGAGDIWQNYWNFWWWKKCLLEGLNPLHTPMLFHPGGADLVFHTHSPFNQVLAMPVNLVFGEAAAYNFCVVFALSLSGFGTYLLVRELTGSAEAGFLSGLVFAYFPQAMEQTLEHLNLFSLQFIPLSLHYLLKWSRSRRRADALAFGACFGLNALCSWHLGLKLALIVLPWIAWILWRDRQRLSPTLRDAGCAFLLATFLVLPVLSPMVVAIAGGATYYLKDAVRRGIDASYLFTPGYANPIFGPLVHARYLDRAYQAAGFVCYLGVLPAALAAVGLRRYGRRVAGWAAVLGTGLLLALGAELLWNGTHYDATPLPFAALRWFPFLENLRVANRFLLPAGLGLAVLAGYGWKSLRAKPAWALPLSAILLLAEYSWTPYPVRPVEISPLLGQVALRPGAVLDIPLHQRSRAVLNMVAQTVHGRPIADGYLSSYPPEIQEGIDREPALRDLAGVPGADAELDIDRLRTLGFRTVILHKDRANGAGASLRAAVGDRDILERKHALRMGGVPDAALAAIRSQLDAALGGPALEDSRLAIYFL